MEGIARVRRIPKAVIRRFAGYFKDKHDSYNGLFYLVAAACVLVAILWCVIVMADSIKGLILGRPIHADALAIPA